jgi:hypothetical protein
MCRKNYMLRLHIRILMPFVSEAQRKKCYVLYNRDIKAGRTPKWNCKVWEDETKRELKRTGEKKLPKYKNDNDLKPKKKKSKSKKSKTKKSKN